eukprot:1214259-Prorocentrum_lima.AAC.1
MTSSLVGSEMCIRDRYKEELKKAQTEVGSLQWLAQKTRPDIACVIAIAASVQTKQPKEAQILLL